MDLLLRKAFIMHHLVSEIQYKFLPIADLHNNDFIYMHRHTQGPLIVIKDFLSVTSTTYMVAIKTLFKAFHYVIG